MKSLTEEEVLQNPDALFDAAAKEPILIVRADGRHVVMLSEAEWNSIQETLYLLSNPANAAHLRRSIEELDQGLYGGQIT